MRDVPSRRFTLADAMIVVAATAIGLGGFIASQDIDGRPRMPTAVSEYVRLTSFQFVIWSWAIVIMRLCPPRPALWRVGRQPGFVACLAVGVFSLTRWCYEIPEYIGHLDNVKLISFINLFVLASWPFFVCPAIIVAWLTLALGGNWRPEASWIDRLGRALGIVWLAASVLLACLWFDS
jgi:hypothetical protein